MKAILWLAGTKVESYRIEDGSSGDELTALDPGNDLAGWFRRGWKFHTGLPSNLNGATVIVLRDGKSLDAKPDS